MKYIKKLLQSTQKPQTMHSKGGLVRIGGREIPYEIKRYARQKSIKIHIRGSGILVTAARRTSLTDIRKVIEGHAQWICEHIGAPKYQVTVDPKIVRKLSMRLRIRIEERLHHFNAHYGLSYSSVTVRNQKTRWGSCSSDGNLSFNIHMITLSDHLFDYVVVHELCHLREMNHSRDFWKLVGETIPHYQKCRHELKEHHL